LEVFAASLREIQEISPSNPFRDEDVLSLLEVFAESFSVLFEEVLAELSIAAARSSEP
jgi:hypothetical protein